MVKNKLINHKITSHKCNFTNLTPGNLTIKLTSHIVGILQFPFSQCIIEKLYILEYYNIVKITIWLVVEDSVGLTPISPTDSTVCIIGVNCYKARNWLNGIGLNAFFESDSFNPWEPRAPFRMGSAQNGLLIHKKGIGLHKDCKSPNRWTLDTNVELYLFLLILKFRSFRSIRFLKTNLPLGTPWNIFDKVPPFHTPQKHQANSNKLFNSFNF